ncbi:MAG: capsule assembly Wzi family protein [Steroidobacteraceae bacterium]
MIRRPLMWGLSLLGVMLLCGSALASGVSPYLPLNLDPAVQNAIDRVLILGDQPVLVRPIPAALVLRALPKACRVDRPLCERVRKYLRRYMQGTGVEFTSVTLAATGGKSNITLPNQHGRRAQSPYQVSGAAYIQPNPYMLLNVGGVGYQGRFTPTGTMLSLGFDWAQLDIGWRDHWWSPLTDSSMLISTEAPTMPSITLSNTLPLTRLGLQYQVFVARMSEQRHIELTNGTFTQGYPKMGGIMVGIQPVSGWSLGVQRVMIWGGGAAGGESLTNIMQAFINPAKAQSTGFNAGTHVVAKQEASVTSDFIFPGPEPFSVYFEYAANDTSMGRAYLFGKPDISAGIDFARLGPFDLTYEFNSWSPTWYVHTATNVQTGYQYGITNYNQSIGNWFGDQRVLATAGNVADEVGGQSNMLRVGWTPPFGGYLQLRLRELANEAQTVYASYPYKTEYMGALSYSFPWNGYAVGAEIGGGQDVFGHHYIEVEGFLRDGEALFRHYDPVSAFSGKRPKGDNLFVNVGVNYYHVLVYKPNGPATIRYYRRWAGSPSVTLGARRRISAHQDIGVGLDLDSISGRLLLGLRMVDYRYRFDWPIAIHAFVGAARYSGPTPAYGLYLGTGVEWLHAYRGWNVGLDFRSVASAQRLDDLRTEHSHLDTYYTIDSWSLYLSHDF